MKMRNFRLIPVVLLVIALAILPAGCVLLPAEEELLQPPLKEPAKITYDTVAVEKVALLKNEVLKTGYFMSTTNEDVYYTKDPGKLYKVYVRLNDAVKKGDILAELENDSYKDSIDQQTLRLKSLKIDLDAAKVLADAGGTFEKQRINIQLAKDKLEDLNADYQTALSGTSEAAKLNAAKQVEAQESAIKLLQLDYDLSLKTAKDNYEKAKINYQLAQEQLAQYQAKYDACLLRAPSSGIITEVAAVSVGANISTYQTLFKVSDPTKMIIWCNSGTAQPLLTTGTKINVRLTESNVTQVGTVILTYAEMSVAEQKAAGAPDIVYIKVPNLLSSVRVNDAASLNLTLWEAKDVIAIETYLLQVESGRYFVRVLENDIQVERDVVPAKNTDDTPKATNTMTIIESGLKVGDLIVK